MSSDRLNIEIEKHQNAENFLNISFNFQFIFLSTTSLPIRTGPSFTAVERAKYLQQLGYDVILIFPYLCYNEQENYWGYKMNRDEFLNYLKKEYNTNIPIFLYDSKLCFGTFQFPSKIIQIYETVKSIMKSSHMLVIEDPEPIFLLTFLRDLKNDFHTKFDKIISIHHTQYNLISRRKSFFPIWLCDIIHANLSKICSKFDRMICISKSIQMSMNIPENLKNHLVAPIHGVNEKYFNVEFNQHRNGKFYFMGKIDPVHKCLDLMLNCAKKANISIDLFGKIDGKTNILEENEEFFNYKGLSCNPVEDLKEYEFYISTSDLEGLCTVTIEALLMHKKILLRNCLCNEIFFKYKNVFAFNDENDFHEVLEFAKNSPVERRDSNLDDFMWENCNRVFLDILNSI